MIWLFGGHFVVLKKLSLPGSGFLITSMGCVPAYTSSVNLNGSSAKIQAEVRNSFLT